MESNFETNFFALLALMDLAGRLEVEHACTEVSFPAHHVIYEQGTPSDSVYVVASGMVEALTRSPDGKQTRSIGFMRKGEFFGDLGVITAQPRLASIRTC
jgi:CRP-like cAMP-binding protein